LPGFLPCGFFPFDVFPVMGSHSSQGYPPPGFCSLLSVSHALKVLLRPPPAGLVSCRSRPWGFPSGPISTRRAVRPFGRPLPSCGWSENLHFRALVPASVSRFRKSKADPETATLLGFTSLGVSPFSPGSEDHPLVGFMGNEHELVDHCPSECCRRKGWLDSLEPAAPFEVCSPHQQPSSSPGG
jgi:hypothetical protein